jgi:hypothetical protein
MRQLLPPVLPQVYRLTVCLRQEGIGRVDRKGRTLMLNFKSICSICKTTGDLS